MTRLDENRAKAQLAKKAGVEVTEVSNMTIWGNHSATQYPDFYNAKIGGKSAADVIGDESWLKETFIPAVQQRGRGDHQSTRTFIGRLRGECDHRHGSFPNDCHPGKRLEQRRRSFRWQLRSCGRPDLLVSRAHEWKELGDRPGCARQ